MSISGDKEDPVSSIMSVLEKKDIFDVLKTSNSFQSVGYKRPLNWYLIIFFSPVNVSTSTSVITDPHTW